jgi:hypothetical protein
MRAMVIAGVLLVGVATAHAEPYDGSIPMKCAIQTVMICSDPSVCVRGTAATAQLPPVVIVDVAGQLISGDRAGRTAKIVSVRHGGGRLLLRGEEVQLAGTAWNIVVEAAAGGMTGAVLSRSGGYLVFGACGAR